MPENPSNPAVPLSCSMAALSPSPSATGLDSAQAQPDVFISSSTQPFVCEPEKFLARRRSGYERCKPAIDFVLALFLLFLTAPAILLAALLVKVTSRGPAFYTQVRLGLHGRRYVIFKLRTMYQDSEAKTGAVWSPQDDPRVTPVGKVLRATHVDEFPQLLNILRGEMSLTGPRPERPEIVEFLKTKIDGYFDRLQVRPGITGLAQVQLPPDTNLDGVRKKLVCDLYYIERLGAWLDLRIVLSTGLLLFGVPLCLSRRLLRIPEPTNF